MSGLAQLADNEFCNYNCDEQTMAAMRSSQDRCMHLVVYSFVLVACTLLHTAPQIYTYGMHEASKPCRKL